LITEPGITAKRLKFINPIRKTIRTHVKTVLILYEPAGICLGMTQVKETDGVEDNLERVLFSFEDLGGEGLVATFAKVKLYGFVLNFARRSAQ